MCLKRKDRRHKPHLITTSKKTTDFEARVGKMGTRIAQWYTTGLRAGRSGVRNPAGAKNFSHYDRVQTGSGAHPASYPMVSRGPFPAGKEAGP
jgi:hypothetical protein